MKCANDIFKVWTYAQEKGQSHPEALLEFRTRLEKRVKATSGRTLDEWIKLGSRTHRSIEKWSTIISKNWACGVMEILPKNRYATDKLLSVNILKGLAQLSGLKSLDFGRKLLQEAIDHRKMPSKNGGKNSYGTYLLLQDVTEAIGKAREIQDNAQAVATSNKRKRDAPSTPSPSAASLPLTEEMLRDIPDETPDPAQQDLPNKRSSAESWWHQRLWSPKGHQRDDTSLTSGNEILDPDLAGSPSEPASVVQETDVLDEAFTVHQNTPVLHQQVEDTIDQDLVFHQDDTKIYRSAKSQEPFPTEVQGFHSMSPEQVRDKTMSPLRDFDSCLGPTTISPCNQSPTLDSDIGSPSDQASRMADAHPSGPEKIDENRVRSITPLQRGNHADGTLGTWAYETSNENEVEARPMVSAPSYIEKARLQTPSSLGSLKTLSGPVIPTSDLEGAISSLRPGTSLSSTAIQLTLEYCHTAGVRIFDPSFLSSASQKSLKPLSPGDSTLIFPLQVNGNHWALIVVDTANVTAEFWSSLLNPEYNTEAQNAVYDLGRSLRGRSDRMSSDPALTEWTLAPQSCPRQDNNYDCGIYTIVFAMYRILNLPLPQSIDSHLWRQMLRVLLDEGTELSLNDQERHSNEGPTPDPTEGAVTTSEVVDVLRQETALLVQSLHRSQCDVTWIEGIRSLSEIFQERQTKLHEGYVNELHEVTEQATVVSNALDKIDVSDDGKIQLARTQTILHKYEKTKQAKIQSELSRIDKVMQGWARVTKTCGKEYETRKGRVHEANDEIRRMILKLGSLVEVVGQLQDELRASIS